MTYIYNIIYYVYYIMIYNFILCVLYYVYIIFFGLGIRDRRIPKTLGQKTDICSSKQQKSDNLKRWKANFVNFILSCLKYLIFVQYNIDMHFPRYSVVFSLLVESNVPEARGFRTYRAFLFSAPHYNLSKS